MSDITIRIADATLPQLRYFAETVLGLPIAANAGAAAIRSKIEQAGYQRDEIGGPEHIGQPATRPPAAVVETDRDAEYIMIMIAKTDEPGGDQPVWVSVNGRGMYIERGKEQKIRLPYLRVLENAVRTVYEQADAMAPIVARDVPSYPFTIVRRAA